MKTLDETIKALEEIVSLTNGESESEGYFLALDSLRYLKEYQRYQKTPSRNGRMALVDYFEEQQKNEPLTWEELHTMEGKPVWVEVDGKERWRIIREVSSEHLIFESGLPLHKSWMNLPDGWQAYRKERG